MENELQNENPLELTERIKNYLLETAKWGKFIAIFGYIGMGLMAVIGLIMLFGRFPYSNNNNSAFSGVPLGFMGFMYLVIAGVYYFPTTFLYKFATKIKNALLYTDQDDLTSSFHYLSKLFMFIGIVTIIALAIYALSLLILVPMLFFIQR
jgi:hypothetical protein